MAPAMAHSLSTDVTAAADQRARVPICIRAQLHSVRFHDGLEGHLYLGISLDARSRAPTKKIPRAAIDPVSNAVSGKARLRLDPDYCTGGREQSFARS